MYTGILGVVLQKTTLFMGHLSIGCNKHMQGLLQRCVLLVCGQQNDTWLYQNLDQQSVHIAQIQSLHAKIITTSLCSTLVAHQKGTKPAQLVKILLSTSSTNNPLKCSKMEKVVTYYIFSNLNTLYLETKHLGTYTHTVKL